DEKDHPAYTGKSTGVKMIVDEKGAVQGYLLLGTRRWGSSLNIFAASIADGVNWQEVMPALLRALQAHGMQMPVLDANTPPFDRISFYLGSEHPIYEVLGNELAPFYEPPYAWYVRVPNLLAFLRHIAPGLEKHLANSAAAAYTGELTLDFFRGGLRFVFNKGHITQIDPWQAPLYKSDADATCPELVFLQLLFGYRSLAELRYAFPDVRVENGAKEFLLNALFPKRYSWVLS
ncbi:MAG TPA: GNAT family N-acetyltransferase, partial [Ktedonobacteraceae bacterium]|nr:GNAT family N-acetyltransferase [Ktedonobacteraceae bacterium]